MRQLMLMTLLTLPGLTACGSLGGSLHGCVSGYQRPDFAALQQDLKAARIRWTAAGILDYSFDFTQVAQPLLLPTIHVVVRGGTVESAEIVGGNPSGATPPTPGTVETSFQTISKTLTRQQATSCPAVSASYDPGDGHPTSFSSANLQANLADGGGSWTIQNFTRP